MKTKLFSRRFKKINNKFQNYEGESRSFKKEDKKGGESRYFKEA